MNNVLSLMTGLYMFWCGLLWFNLTNKRFLCERSVVLSNMMVKLCLIPGKSEGKKISRKIGRKKKVRKNYKFFFLFDCLWKKKEKKLNSLSDALSQTFLTVFQVKGGGKSFAIPSPFLAFFHSIQT